MNNNVYIRDLSDSQLKATVKLALFTIGVPKKKIEEMDKGEVDTILWGVRKYQGSMWIDTFQQAFHEFASGNIDLHLNQEPSPKMIGRICKAYRDNQFRPTQAQPVSKVNIAPAVDADYYDSLICVMEGKVSARRKMVYPEAKPPKGNEIPMTCNWEAVYRHLRANKQVDEVEEHKQRAEVIKWLYIKYPTATMQSDNFKSSPVFGTSLGQKLKQSLTV